MKVNFKKALLASVLVAISSASFAADTVDLKVTGKITPPACTPSFSGNNTVDFGNIAISALSPTADTMLPDLKKTTLQITCDVPTRFAFTVKDMRSDSIPAQLDVHGVIPNAAQIGSTVPENNFGLGKTTDGKTIGVFGMDIFKVIGDSKLLKPLYRQNSGYYWSSSLTTLAIMNTPQEYAFGADSEPDALSSVAVDINVNALINDTTTMPVTDEITLDGLATFTLVYL